MRVKLRGSWAWVAWASAVGPVGSCATTMPPSSSAPAATSASTAAPLGSGKPLSTAEAPAVEPAPGLARCKPAREPAADTWESLEGCSVSFKSGRVVPERSCTMALCGDRRCCNSCSEGRIAWLSGNDKLLLSNGKTPLTCREGLDCNADRDCDVPPGEAEVTGVLWRREGQWYLDTQRFVRRVGPCELRAMDVTASELSPADGCRASFSCDDGEQLSVSCDGENDGTYSSLCECQLGDRTVSLPKAIPGEAPFACERALEPCLGRAGKKPK